MGGFSLGKPGTDLTFSSEFPGPPLCLRCYINLNAIKLPLDLLQNNRGCEGKGPPEWPTRAKRKNQISLVIKMSKCQRNPTARKRKDKDLMLRLLQVCYVYYFNPCDLKVCVSDKDLPTGQVRSKAPLSSQDACELASYHAVANAVSCTSDATRHPSN